MEGSRVSTKFDEEQGGVRDFWTRSTRDYLSNVPTGIDISGNPDWYWRYLHKWECETALVYCGSGKILDLGCGTGRLTNYLIQMGREEVFSADYIFDAVKVLRDHGPPRRCATMDSTAIGFREGTFDSVLACRVLQSLEEIDAKERALKEIHRLLKPSGRLVLTEGNPVRDRFVKVPYNYYLPVRQWLELLARNGFKVECVRAIPFLTASKVLDRLTLGTLSRFRAIFAIANFMDRYLGKILPTSLSLQVDIVARRL